MQSVALVLSLFMDAGFCYFISLIQLNCWNVYVNDNNWIRSPHHHDICSERWIGRTQEERPSSWTCIAGVRSSQHLIELITSPLWLQAWCIPTDWNTELMNEWECLLHISLWLTEKHTLHLADAFIQRHLQGQYVFPGNRTHNLLRC